MDTEKNEKNREDVNNENGTIKPAEGTLHTTDPQEHMEGPLSSLMHNTGEAIKGRPDENDSSKQ